MAELFDIFFENDFHEKQAPKLLASKLLAKIKCEQQNPSPSPMRQGLMRNTDSGISTSRLVAGSWQPAASLSRRERQQSNVARLLDGGAQSALMWRANPSQPAWDDFAALGDKAREQADILVVDGVDLLDAELADLLAAEEFASAFASSGATRAAGTSFTTWSTILTCAGCAGGCWCV